MSSPCELSDLQRPVICNLPFTLMSAEKLYCGAGKSDDLLQLKIVLSNWHSEGVLALAHPAISDASE